MNRYYTQPVDKLTPSDFTKLVEMALQEDIPFGDITSESIFNKNDICKAKLISRETGILCGRDVVEEICNQTGKLFQFEFHRNEGELFGENDSILTLRGSLLVILKIERILLNFLQYLSGISTVTNTLVKKYNNRITIFDTRKTLPGYRKLVKYAVYTGGGANHRLNLSDMAMLKDNHVAMAGSITNAVKKIREKFPKKIIEVEVDSLSQIDKVVESGAEIILLDNFTTNETIIAIEMLRKMKPTILIECSGGITPEKLEKLAEFEGVGVSMGYLTHTTRFLDLSLEIEKI